MKQITRDLYTSGRVWLSLSHSFSQKPDKGDEFDLVKVNGDFVTLNAGAMFVLSCWTSGVKQPDKFYIPEYKIEYFRSILSSLMELKADPAYVRDGELTTIGKPATLYYRLKLANEKVLDAYFMENDFNGDKAINVALEFESKVHFLYDSNVNDLIDIIPTSNEIAKYKQSAAELYYIETYLLKGKAPAVEKSAPAKVEEPAKKSEPRTVTKVDRTNIGKTEKPVVVAEDPTETPKPDKEDKGKSSKAEATNSGFDYSKLLADE